MVRLNPIERRLERFVREPPSVRKAAVIVIATIVVVVGAGVVMTVIDHDEYPDVAVPAEGVEVTLALAFAVAVEQQYAVAVASEHPGVRGGAAAARDDDDRRSAPRSGIVGGLRVIEC